MRQFLGTLYVTLEDAYLSLDGENIVVSSKKTEIGRVPLHTPESILCFSRSGASPALMGYCARRGIDLCFFSPNGQFLARTVGEERGNVLLRQTQYRVADNEALSCSYARYFIPGKVYNARWVLERATRDHPQRVPVEKLKQVSTQLADQKAGADHTSVPEGKDRMGSCALCTGTASRPDTARRPGALPSVFLKMRYNYACSDHLRRQHGNFRRT